MNLKTIDILYIIWSNKNRKIKFLLLKFQDLSDGNLTQLRVFIHHPENAKRIFERWTTLPIGISILLQEVYVTQFFYFLMFSGKECLQSGGYYLSRIQHHPCLPTHQSAHLPVSFPYTSFSSTSLGGKTLPLPTWISSTMSPHTIRLA